MNMTIAGRAWYFFFSYVSNAWVYLGGGLRTAKRAKVCIQLVGATPSAEYNYSWLNNVENIAFLSLKFWHFFDYIILKLLKIPGSPHVIVFRSRGAWEQG